jgi:hypothetical protein
MKIYKIGPYFHLAAPKDYSDDDFDMSYDSAIKDKGKKVVNPKQKEKVPPKKKQKYDNHQSGRFSLKTKKVSKNHIY